MAWRQGSFRGLQDKDSPGVIVEPPPPLDSVVYNDCSPLSGSVPTYGRLARDLERAFALYDRNIEASAAALSPAAMVEVVVRNALDAQAEAWARSRGGGDWLTGAPLDYCARADIQKAKGRAARGAGG